MASARKSVVLSAVSNICTLVLSLVLLVVVTRWLTPIEIGSFVVAYAIFAILESLRLLQIVSYVIQASDFDYALMQRVQFVGLVATGVILAVSLLVGQILAIGFAFTDVSNLLLIMSGAYILKAIAQPSLAVLHRDMRFDRIAAVKLTGAAAKVIVTIVLLFLGWREEALAIGIVVEIACEIACVFFVKLRYAFPKPSPSRARTVWDFCFKFSGAQLVNTLPQHAIDVIVASSLGLAAAGFYNRANRLVMVARSAIEGAIFPVALAIFSKSDKVDRATKGENYLSAIALLTGFTWPCLALLIVAAEPIVLTAYGPDWRDIVILVQIIALGAMIFAATAMADPLLASVGAVDILLKRNLMVQIPRMVFVVAAVQYSLVAVSWAAVVTMLVVNVVTARILKREFKISYGKLIKALWRSGALALICIAPAWMLLKFEEFHLFGILPSLLSAMGLGIAFWIIGIFVLKHPINSEFEHVFAKLNSRFFPND